MNKLIPYTTLMTTLSLGAIGAIAAKPVSAVTFDFSFTEIAAESPFAYGYFSLEDEDYDILAAKVTQAGWTDEIGTSEGVNWFPSLTSFLFTNAEETFIYTLEDVRTVGGYGGFADEFTNFMNWNLDNSLKLTSKGEITAIDAWNDDLGGIYWGSPALENSVQDNYLTKVSQRTCSNESVQNLNLKCEENSTSVPEPSTIMALILCGLASLVTKKRFFSSN